MSTQKRQLQLGLLALSIMLYWTLLNLPRLTTDQAILSDPLINELKQLFPALLALQGVWLMGRFAWNAIQDRPIRQKVIVIVPLPDGAKQEMIPLLLESDDLQIYHWMKTHGHAKKVRGGVRVKYKGDPVFFRSTTPSKSKTFRLDGNSYTPVAIKILKPKH